MSDTFRVAQRAIVLACVVTLTVIVGPSARAAPPVQRLVAGLQLPWGGSCHPGTITVRTSKPGSLDETAVDVACKGERTVLQVSGPGKFHGATLVREGQEVWQASTGGRLHRVSAAGQRRSWLGSDFTIADLLGMDAYSRDYDGVATFTGEHEGVEITALTLRATGPRAAWSKIEALVRAADGLPQHLRFYDRDGVLVRRELFSSPPQPEAASGASVLQRIVPEESATAGFSELVWQPAKVAPPTPIPHLASNAHRRRP